MPHKGKNINDIQIRNKFTCKRKQNKTKHNGLVTRTLKGKEGKNPMT